MSVAADDVKSLFGRALELPDPAARAAFLAEACGGNSALRAEVEGLLAALDGAGGFLKHVPAPDATGAVPSDTPATATFGAASVGPTADYLTKDERAGAVIGGKYTLVEPVGEGGMGSVWRAKQTEPVKRFVAVKLIKAGMDSKRVLARFEAERQALALMDHPNIAKVLDGGLHEGRPFFVMELVKGMSITDYCDECKLTPKDRLELFVPVCQAIQHAHNKGVIHRDIKPSNVLVALYDDRPVVKVIDFGVAKATGGALTEMTIDTGFGGVVGTPQYMSPEQATFNNLDIDTRSDVYALGVLLYELLTGSPPFAREDLEKKGLLEILRVVREEEPPRPSTKLSTTDALPTLSANRGTEPRRLTGLLRNELDWIVMKAIEKNRSRRYETANGLGADVQRYLSGEPVAAHPPTVGYRLRKLYRRNRTAVLTGSSFLCLIAVAAVASGLLAISASRAARQAHLAEQEARRQEQAASLSAGRALQSETDARQSLAGEKASRDRLARVEYARSMQLAHRAWQDNNVAATAKLLEDAAPELRGWEWYYLNRLCHPELLTLKGHTDAVAFATFSADGSRILTSSYDKTARVWDARTGAEVLVLNAETLLSFASFNPDGSRIVTPGAGGTAVVWDARTGKELLRLTEHTRSVRFAVFSPDGSRIATASNDKTAKVWDAETGKVLLTLEGHTDSLQFVSFQPDGSRLATASWDQTVKVWDAKIGKEFLTIRVGSDFDSASFNRDGTRVVTNIRDKTAKVWDSRTGAEVLALDGHTDLVWFASFNSEGSRIVTAAKDKSAKVWDARTGAVILTLRGHTGAVRCATFDAAGSRIVTAGTDGTAKVWDLNAVYEPLMLRGHISTVPSASFSPDGKRLVTGSYDKTAKVWDAETGNVLLTLQGHRVVAASFNHDGSQIVTASSDMTAKVWDAKTGAELRSLPGHTLALHSASFSPDGRQIVTASADSTTRVWDVESGVEVRSLKGHLVRSASFSRDGSRIVSTSGGEDSSARVWDAATGQELLTFKGHARKGQQITVRFASFSPDGKRVVSCGANVAKLWDSRTGAELLTLEGHSDEVLSAAFNSDGSRIVTTSQDQTTRVWSAENGLEMLTLKTNPPAKYPGSQGGSASFSPDGWRIVTSGGLRATVWDARPPNRVPRH